MIRRKISTYIRRILVLDETPERLAFAFALGVFLTLTPFLGLHTILALAIAFLFGLNRIALLFGMFINNPWTLVPYYTAATYLGGRLMGFPRDLGLHEFQWTELLHGGFWLHAAHQWRILMPLAVGSTVLAVLCAALSYPLALCAIRRGRMRLRTQSLLDS